MSDNGYNIEDLGPYSIDLGRCKIRLTKEEEVALHRRIQEGDVAARNLLVESVLPMVVKIARNYHRSHDAFQLGDLISAGNEGAIHATTKFDPALARFTTYSQCWIRQRITRFIAIDNLIHVPEHAHAHPELKDHAAAARGRKKSIYDLLAGGTSHARRTLADTLIDPRTDDPTAQVDAEDTTALLRRHIKRLEPRRRQVIYGRLAGKAFRVIGEEMGICMERARQLDRDARNQLAKSIGRERPELASQGMVA